MTKLKLPQSEWEDLAHLDPLWAILTDKRKQFRQWTDEEFFASGRREIEILMSSCGFRTGDNGRVVDFGCGVGRLSRAFQSYFGEVYGVDISDQMIRLAKQYTPSCSFILNQADNLRIFQDNFADFVYSNIVLQHQPSGELAKTYIAEFIRIAKPSALVAFQIPYRLSWKRRLQPRRRLYSLLRLCKFPSSFLYNTLHLNPMHSVWISPKDVAATVSRAGGRVIVSRVDDFNENSMSYVVTKN